MLTARLLTSCLLASLIGCASSPAKPTNQSPTSVDWAQVDAHLTRLAAPIEPTGKIRFRWEAEDGEALWNLSGRQTQALRRSNARAVEMRDYVRDVVTQARETEAQARRDSCAWWRLRRCD